MSTTRSRATIKRRSLPFTLVALTGALGSTPALAGIASVAYVNPAGTCDYPSIQAAIDNLAPGSEIRLAGDEFPLAASLTLANRQLRIVGGYPACGAPDVEGRSTLHATFAGGPVLNVFGNAPGALNLELVNLTITDGDNPASGGGLQIVGLGQVTLQGVDLLDNVADSGGGLHAVGIGGTLGVNLLGGSQVGNEEGVGNSATFGGGIYCSNARLRLGHATIRANAATDRGGGLFSDSCEVLSTDAAGDLRIEANRARDGGGIYATGPSLLTLRSRPQQKISISYNEASVGAPPQRGGGVYLAGNDARLIASGVHIDNNLARSFGAGLMLQGAEAVMDRDTDGCALGDAACSSLSGNEVRDAMGGLAGSAAAAFVAGTGKPTLSLSHTRISGNAAAASVLAVGDAGILSLSNALIAANHSNGDLLQSYLESEIHADFVTLTDNLLPGAALRIESTAVPALDLRRSIVLVEPGSTHLAGNGNVVFACLNTGAGGELGGADHQPGFASAEVGDYRLAPGSQNLDRCAVVGGESPFDIAGYPRIVDDPDVANDAGAADRGAFEDTSRLFQDGFED